MCRNAYFRDRLRHLSLGLFFMRRSLLVLLSLTLAVFAGCFGGADNEDDDGDDVVVGPPIDALGRSVSRIAVENSTAVVALAAGGLSEVRAEDGPVTVGLPPNAWRLDGKRLVQADYVDLEAGGSLTFLVPPAAENLTLLLAPPGALAGSLTPDRFNLPDPRGNNIPEMLARFVHVLPTQWTWGASFASGAEVVELMEVQRDEYPHRTPGMPNYERAQDYFVKYFIDLGYTDVFKDPVLNSLPQPDGLPLGIKPQSLANVYAYRAGTGTPDRIIAFGGHYDMVDSTRDAAFDDTSGTLMTLAMAKAFADIETDVGLLFGLWGGEEDGLLGSEYFVRTHPDLVAQTILYINFDVSALAWPGPTLEPDPIIISPGPDGPVADELITQAQRIYSTYLPELPSDMQTYEPVGEGQATGQGGVNAQSDHTSFMAAGVPVYFPFTGNVSNAFAFIHSPYDTLHNLTWFMATQGIITGVEEEPDMSPAEEALGRELLAKSMETFMALGVYSILEIDAGLWSPPGRGPPPGPLHA